MTSKSRVFRLFVPLALCAVAFTAAGREQGQAKAPAKPADKAPVVAKPAPSAVEILMSRVPFCPPGEKVVCTLGPPPVCSCQ